MRLTGTVQLITIGLGETRLLPMFGKLGQLNAEDAVRQALGTLKADDKVELTVRKIKPPPAVLPPKFKLTADEQALLWTFAGSYNCWEEESWCLGFSAMPFERTKSRRIARRLKRLGLLAFAQGLFTDDGETAGAGYHLTNLGREAITYMTLLSEEVRFG